MTLSARLTATPRRPAFPRLRNAQATPAPRDRPAQVQPYLSRQRRPRPCAGAALRRRASVTSRPAPPSSAACLRPPRCVRTAGLPT